MRKLLLIFGVAAVAALASVEADARAGGSRSSAARYAPSLQGPTLRLRLNRELVRRLHLPCPKMGRRGPRWRCG